MFRAQLLGVIVLGISTALAAACSSPGVSCPAPGGPVAGGQDSHCGAKVQPTSAASCHPPMPDLPGTGDGGAADGGTADNPYGPTVYNAESDDDDCKYHVKWSVSTVCENADVTFTVTATKKTDGSALTRASPRAEVFLNETHPAPNSDQKATETQPGTYAIGPIRFDAAGRWTVRFHFFEECADLNDDSPHGHAAFYLNVP